VAGRMRAGVTPLGWYPDPQQPQLLRWWDGYMWWSEWSPADGSVLTASARIGPLPAPTANGVPMTSGHAKPITANRIVTAIVFFAIGGQAVLLSALWLAGGQVTGVGRLLAAMLGVAGAAVVAAGAVAWIRPEWVNVRVLRRGEMSPWVQWEMSGHRTPRPKRSVLRGLSSLVGLLGLAATLYVRLRG